MKKLLLALLLAVAPVLAADCDDIAESAIHNKKVTVLDLSNKNLKDIEFIKGYTNLEELDLSENDFESVAPLVGLKHLRKLNLHHCHHIKDLELLGKIISIQKLNISSIYIDDEVDQPTLDFIRPLKNLEELDISYNVCIYKINPLAILPKLKILTLVSGYSASIEDWFSLNHFFTLKELTISREDIRRFPPLEGVTINLV
jgi:Leucine-rich repeat (LRR) protein